ncbi:hypothetical protein, partial [Massilia mucilaginosa]|uniref:hypothetical protein n=1 Tax=Massilia mucilaginosa TaxID=2609282 RepID=UPI001420F85D
ESRLKAIGDDIKNGQRFADASLDQSSRLFNPDSDGDIRSDWGGGEGAVPGNSYGVKVMTEIVVNGDDLAWYETAWNYVKETAGAVGDFVSEMVSPRPGDYDAVAPAPYYRNPNIPSDNGWIHGPLASKYVGQQSYITALPEHNSNPYRSNSFEQQVARGINVPVTMTLNAGYDVGAGSRRIGNGDYAGGGLQVATGALSVASLAPWSKFGSLVGGKVAGRLLSEEVQLKYALQAGMKTALGADLPIRFTAAESLMVNSGVNGGASVYRLGAYSAIEAEFASLSGQFSQKLGASAYDAKLANFVNG